MLQKSGLPQILVEKGIKKPLNTAALKILCHNIHTYASCYTICLFACLMHTIWSILNIVSIASVPNLWENWILFFYSGQSISLLWTLQCIALELLSSLCVVYLFFVFIISLMILSVVCTIYHQMLERLVINELWRMSKEVRCYPSIWMGEWAKP